MGETGARPSSMSPFQARVLSEIAMGATDREVAETIGLGYQQVRHAVRGAMQALGARSRAEAVYRATVSGVIPVALIVAPDGDPSAAADGDRTRICA